MVPDTHLILYGKEIIHAPRATAGPRERPNIQYFPPLFSTVSHSELLANIGNNASLSRLSSVTLSASTYNAVFYNPP